MRRPLLAVLALVLSVLLFLSACAPYAVQAWHGGYCETGAKVWLHVLNDDTAVRFPALDRKQFGHGRDSVQVERYRFRRRSVLIERTVGLNTIPRTVPLGHVPCGHATIQVAGGLVGSVFCGDRPEACALANRPH